jgi:hypothetical protein
VCGERFSRASNILGNVGSAPRVRGTGMSATHWSFEVFTMSKSTTDYSSFVLLTQGTPQQSAFI